MSETGIAPVDVRAGRRGAYTRLAPGRPPGEQHPDIDVAQVDTEADRAIAGALGNSSSLTVAIFRDGVPVFAQAGRRRPRSAAEVRRALLGGDRVVTEIA